MQVNPQEHVEIGGNPFWTLKRGLLSPALNDMGTQGGTNSQFHFLVPVTKCHGESEDGEIFHGGEEDRGQRGTFFSNILASSLKQTSVKN